MAKFQKNDFEEETWKETKNNYKKTHNILTIIGLYLKGQCGAKSEKTYGCKLINLSFELIETQKKWKIINKDLLI